jgi:amino acid permease
MFSIFTLACTLISLGIVLGLETEIQTHSYRFIEREMAFHLGDKDFAYKYIDWHRLPIVSSVFMALYEGTSVIVTIYSEASEPKHFVRNMSLGYSFVAVFGILFGYFSYLTLGDKCNDIILLVLPNGSHWAIFCKVMYLITIMGSYVIMS